VLLASNSVVSIPKIEGLGCFPNDGSAPPLRFVWCKAPLDAATGTSETSSAEDVTATIRPNLNMTLRR
jgi:hypothetical protein